MSESDVEWDLAAIENGWVMPTATWWKRLPLVRHVRALYLGMQVARHNTICRQLGLIPSGYDKWVVFGIWAGLERTP